MRHVVGDRIGRTDFFRDAPFLLALVELLRPVSSPLVLARAAATGAEPYSLVMASRLAAFAADVEPSFLEIARRGTYQEAALGKATREAMKFFVRGSEPSTVKVAPDVRASVAFLSPTSFVAFQMDEVCDATVALNSLTYLSRQEEKIGATARAQFSAGDPIMRAA